MFVDNQSEDGVRKVRNLRTRWFPVSRFGSVRFVSARSLEEYRSFERGHLLGSTVDTSFASVFGAFRRLHRMWTLKVGGPEAPATLSP